MTSRLSLLTAIILTLVTPTLHLAATTKKPLPQIPNHCQGEIGIGDYCAITSTTGMLSGSIEMKIFAVVEKDDFTGPDELIEIFTDVAAWPEYVENTGSRDLVINQSANLASSVNTDGFISYQSYADYKIQTPIGYQPVRSVTISSVVEPYAKAIRSLEFSAQTKGPQPVPLGAKPLKGAEGVKSHTGSVHVADCVEFDICPNNQYLLIYETSIKPSVNLLPKVAASSILKATEALLVGMFMPLYYDALEYPPFG